MTAVMTWNDYWEIQQERKLERQMAAMTHVWHLQQQELHT
jgi:hypothetical protein